MRSLSSLAWPLLAALVAAVLAHASASAHSEAAARCTSEASLETEAAERGTQGSVLLQLTSDSSSKKAWRTAAKTEAKQGTNDEELAEYTKLKQRLAQSKESAHIMKKIDEALDGGLENPAASPDKVAATANDVHSLSDVLKLQDSLAEGPRNLQQILARDSPKVPAHHDAPHQASPGLSLLEAGSTKSVSHSTKLAKKEDDEEEDSAENADKEEENAEEENTNEENTEEDEEASAEEGESESENADNTDAEESDDSEAESAAAKKARRKLSLMAVVDVMKADRAPLNENGYLDIVEARSNRRMERFVERLASEMSLVVVDVGGLKGVVPFFSGQKATQSLEALQAEMLSTARMTDGWLKHTRQSRPVQDHMLLQTDATESHAADVEVSPNASSAGPVSMLAMSAVVRAVHKVPDLAVGLFGSRTIVLLCTASLLLCLFFIDERKRKGKGLNYEDLLNLSPEPPPMKEDARVAASLKLLRGVK